MLDSWLIEVEDAYRRPLSIKKEEVKEEVKEVVKAEVKEEVKEVVKAEVKEVVEKKAFTIDKSLIDMENWEEHYVRKGDPSKPTYYIIRRKPTSSGIWSHFHIYVGHIRYALSKGWIPVIDMQNTYNIYLGSEKVGKENAWEYYFEQPLRIGLEEAYNGENIILSREFVSFPQTNTILAYENKGKYLEPYRNLLKQGYLRVKEDLYQEILAYWKKLFAPTDRVLGVKLRGTDYTDIKPKNHPIPPPIEYARDVILEKLRIWKCNKIFLSTEDKTIAQFFKDTFVDGFGTFYFTLDKKYVNYDGIYGVGRCLTNRENDRFLNGKEYVMEMVMLSMCNSFVTAMTSGSLGVMILANNFENVHAFNLGNYGVMPVDWRKLIEQ